MIASSPKHVGMMQDFKSMADFMRLFVLLQGGCDTPMEQPYRAVDFKAKESSDAKTSDYGLMIPVQGNNTNRTDKYDVIISWSIMWSILLTIRVRNGKGIRMS